MAFQQFPQKGGIPSGVTAARPSSPASGDTFYNGQLGILEIWTGSAWFPCSAPPATPTNVVATDTSSADAYSASGGKLSVSFTAGSGGGQPTNYIVYTTTGGFSTSGASSPLVLTGLTPGEAYTVYAVAQNGFGNSAASANAAAVTPTTVAQAPTIGTATDASIGGGIYLTFTAGASGGKTITNYKYELNSSGTFTAFSPAQTSSPLTISGLTDDTAYTIKLKAVTANGDSPASSASNSATPTNTVTVDFLVVAGGGSGGSKASAVAAGGGGAGGMKSSVSNTGGSVGTLKTALVLNKGTAYTCSVGAGGTAFQGQVDETGQRANSGTNSFISGTGITTMTATGGSGGHGGQGNSNAPLSGGSGGGAGAGDFAATGGDGGADEGFKGGNSAASGSNPSRGGGGGGGASAAGGNAGAGQATAGGAGQSNSITGSSITYAGGGGAATYLTAASGGSGGGGAGSISGPATAGTANLGGGGGAYVNNGTANSSGAGGSGVVIIRALVAAVSTTGSPTATTSGSYYIYKFTGTGTITF